jgi:protein TonB
MMDEAVRSPLIVPDGLPLHRAAGMALLVEAILVGGTIWWLMTAPPAAPPPARPAPMQLHVVELPPAPVPAPPAPPTPPPPDPKPVVKEPPPPQPVQKPVVKPQPHPVAVVPTTPPPPDAAPAPAAIATDAPVEPPAPPPPPAAAAPSADAIADFNARANAAIQAVVVYPLAAKALGREGRVRVGFNFTDGVVSAVEVIESSGLEVFDRTAVTTVETAAYPPTPAEMRHRTVPLKVWVEFVKKQR